MKVLAPNTLLQNRYLIVHLIGKGGMGEVYLAVDQRLGSAVALKRTYFSEHESLGSAFEREARILGRLRHAVLPKVSDHFIENDNQYLVMEHISGDDLAKRLELTQKPFPLSWVLFWADQLLDALWYLHSHEPPIIHRDIKPQNLKLTDENNIILLDFGLSKSSIGDSRISQPVGSNVSGSVVGYTPHYAPMEQIRGTGTSPRSDLYALSATLYQLLTNSVPPDALTRADALLNGSPDPVRPINEINAEVNKLVSDVIIKGMAVSQDLRYTNAREMQKELRDAYAQMQKAMSAQTIAFTASESSAAPTAPEKTEPLISVAPVSTHDLVTETETPAKTGAKTEFLPVQDKQPDFDATMHYDGEIQQFDNKQSNIKTEVFSGGISGLGNGAASKNPEAPSQSPTEENFAPGASEPLIRFDGKEIPPSQPDFNTKVEKTGDPAPATELYTPNKNHQAAEVVPSVPATDLTDNFSFTQDNKPEATQFSGEQYKPENYNSQPQPVVAAAVVDSSSVAPVAAQPQKTSSGKTFIILGVLGLMLFLGIGTAGLGWWYMYGGGAVVTEATPTPTPTNNPTPSVSPTPTPDETMAGGNSNTDTNSLTNSETNTNLTNTSEVNGTNTIKTEVTKTTPTPPINRVTPTPQIIRVTPTPGTRVTPTPKIRVTPTPKKGSSTDILQ